MKAGGTIEVVMDADRGRLLVRGRASLADGLESEEALWGRMPEEGLLGSRDIWEVDASGMEGDREGILITCQRLRRRWGELGTVVRWVGVPEEAAPLWGLVVESPYRSTAGKGEKGPLLHRLRDWLVEALSGFLIFLGELVLDLGRILRGKVRFRTGIFLQKLYDCTINALPIVALIGILIGLILAYISAVQLMKFGASIYVPNLVSVSIVREMGPVMIAIIMCGRTGAAYAAELGSMKVSQEVDALRAMGVSPMEYLVLPRLMALVVALPMLVLIGSILGILSGGFISMIAFEISWVTFFNQVQKAVDLTSVWGALFKSGVFGMLVGFAGTWRGMQCGSSSAEVGRVTTSAVVTGITWIIIADALFAVIYNLYGI